MRNVYLPVEHSEAELVLAGQLADMLESSTLYVTWGPQGYVHPEVETLLRHVDDEPAAEPEPMPGLLVEVLGTMAAFVAAIFGPRQAPRGQSGASPA